MPNGASTYFLSPMDEMVAGGLWIGWRREQWEDGPWAKGHDPPVPNGASADSTRPGRKPRAVTDAGGLWTRWERRQQEDRPRTMGPKPPVPQ